MPLKTSEDKRPSDCLRHRHQEKTKCRAASTEGYDMCARKFPLFGSSRMLVMLNRLADMAGLLETSADVVQGPRPVFCKPILSIYLSTEDRIQIVHHHIGAN